VAAAATMASEALTRTTLEAIKQFTEDRATTSQTTVAGIEAGPR
jgi:hypothetical protein